MSVRPMVAVYGRGGCVQCVATLRQLSKLGIPHHTLDVDADPDTAEVVRSLGYRALPVVVVDECTHWSGFRPDRISQLAM